MAAITLPQSAYNLDNDATDLLNATARKAHDGDNIVITGPMCVNGTFAPNIDPDRGPGAYRTLTGATWTLPDQGAPFVRQANPPVVGRNPGDPAPADISPIVNLVGCVKNVFTGNFHVVNTEPPAINTGYTTREWDHALLLQGQSADHPQGMALCAHNRIVSFSALGAYGDGLSFEVGPNEWAAPYANDITVKRISGVGRQAITVAVGGWRDAHGRVWGNHIGGIPGAPMYLDALRSIFDLEATGKVQGLILEQFVAGSYADSLVASQGNAEGIDGVTIRHGHSVKPLKILVHPNDGVLNQGWIIEDVWSDWPVAANDTTPISIHRTEGLELRSLRQPGAQRVLELGSPTDGTACPDPIVTGCAPKRLWAPYQQ